MGEPVSGPATVAARRLSEGLVFVLVQPLHPGNVGATARAMANMGLHRLILVDPQPSFDPERARWMAPGAHHILERMRIVATLDEALQGVHRVIASTARHRRYNQTVREPAEVAARTFDAPAEHVTAILFGREDHGLANEHTQRCESLLRIPTAENPSLNLSQATLIVAHAMYEEARRRGVVAQDRLAHGPRSEPSPVRADDPKQALASLDEIEPAVTELVALLNQVGHDRASNPDKLGVVVREVLQRTELTRRHVHAMRGMVRRIEFALSRPDIDWQASDRLAAKRDAARDAVPIDAPEPGRAEG